MAEHTAEAQDLIEFLLVGPLSNGWRCAVRIEDGRCNKPTTFVYLTRAEAADVALNVPGSVVNGRLEGENATRYILNKCGVLMCADCRGK